MACCSISFVGSRPPMAHLVASYATSHTGMMIRTFDREDPAQVRVHRAFGQLREEIAILAPDVIIMVSSEHLNSFFYDCYPQFCVALGKESQGWVMPVWPRGAFRSPAIFRSTCSSAESPKDLT